MYALYPLESGAIHVPGLGRPTGMRCTLLGAARAIRNLSPSLERQLYPLGRGPRRDVRPQHVPRRGIHSRGTRLGDAGERRPGW